MTRLTCALILSLVATGCDPAPEDLAANLSSPNPAVRVDTAKIARNFPSEVLEAALVGALDDPAQQVRLNAIDSLIELEATSAVPRLIALLEEGGSDDQQRHVIDALGRRGDPSAVPALVAYVEAREPAPPLNAIWALGELEGADALPVLARLRDASDPYVRYNATAALRKLKPAPPAPPDDPASAP